MIELQQQRRLEFAYRSKAAGSTTRFIQSNVLAISWWKIGISFKITKEIKLYALNGKIADKSFLS